MLKGRTSGRRSKPLLRLAIEPLEDRTLPSASPFLSLPALPSWSSYRNDAAFADHDVDFASRPANFAPYVGSSRELRLTSYHSTDALFSNLFASSSSMTVVSFNTSVSFFSFSFVVFISHDPASSLAAFPRVNSKTATSFQKEFASNLPDGDEVPVRALFLDTSAGQVATARAQANQQLVQALVAESEVAPTGVFSRQDISVRTTSLPMQSANGLAVTITAARESGTTIASDRISMAVNGGNIAEPRSEIPSPQESSTSPTETPQSDVVPKTNQGLDLASYPASQGTIADGLSLGADLPGTVQKLLEPLLLAPTNLNHQLFWWSLSTWVIAAGLAGEYLRRRMNRQQIQSPAEYDWLSRGSR